MSNINDEISAKELLKAKKIESQIRTTKKMIENKEYPIDILQQLASIKSAINSLRSRILKMHLNDSILKTFQENDQEKIRNKIEEIREIFKKY